ncbi:hypothetical protein PITCH_A1900007 [uncultured Desulfobacterium sp.]|uniref:Uncharacterized protein n=1 Tax=uncultured Desulfobacterium sp. TaxID=201089 RepID=A0A445MW60_9BACT|nr:hypothetical protein PITCH_A1900007 [uncultured Desulfobacterium sp.]
MIKNAIIALLLLIITCMGLIYLKGQNIRDSDVVYSVPDLRLSKDETITSADICVETAVIKSIRNIPPGWTFSLELDPPPNPRLVGTITVGAAALESSKELPSIELGRYVKDLAPGSAKATIEITKYPVTNDKPRKVTIDLIRGT